MRVALLALTTALTLAAPGCTAMSFAALGERTVDTEIDGVEHARIGHARGSAYVCAEVDTDAPILPPQPLSFALPAGRTWPEGELPVSRMRDLPWWRPVDAPISLAYTDTAVYLYVDGHRREIQRMRSSHTVKSPAPWLLLPITVAIDVATFPVSIPAYIYLASGGTHY